MANTRTAARTRRRPVAGRPETVVSLLRERALREPDVPVYEFLGDDGEVRSVATTRSLDLRAREIGARLQADGAQGSRAILLLQPGEDLVAAYLGCLYGGVVAIPVLPPEHEQALERVRAIVRDAGARYLFLPPDSTGEPWATACSVDMTVMSPRVRGDGEANDWAPPLLDASALAHLQYTSSADGSPRGVMLTHRNLLHNADLVRRAVDLTPDDRVMSWAPPQHELGLVIGLLQPLLTGCTGVIMDSTSFVQAPLRWLQAISRHRVSVTGAPSFAYDLCVRSTSPRERAGLRLGCLRVAMNGSDAVQPRTLAEFSQAFAPFGFDPLAFFPFYAIAEATFLVTGGGRPTAPVIGAFDSDELELGRARLVPARNGRLIPSCGQPRPGQLVRVVDPFSGRVRAPGEVGEIWIGGPSVAAGYWRRRAESMELFGAFVRDTGEGPFVRTGDLGFLLSGELFVTGRMHVRFELGGRSASAEEVEEVAGVCHHLLRPGGGAAFSAPVAGENGLVIVHELQDCLSGGPPLEHIVGAIRAAVQNALGLPVRDVVLLPFDSLPRTPIGKIRRFVCRQAYVAGTLRPVSTDNSVGPR